MTDKLIALRQKIDQVDDRLLLLLQERVNLMKQIGKSKKNSNLTIRDIEREKEKIEKIKQKALKLNLPQQLITKLWTELFTLSEEIEK